MPGDYATVEADGSITLLGRGSIVINSGGEKIFPEEVESAVRSHPDVMDAIVCGAPDERWGQTVAAIVQPRAGHEAPSLESLQEHCRESIAGYKVPRRLYVVDAVERSPSGKPDYTWAAAIVADRTADARRCQGPIDIPQGVRYVAMISSGNRHAAPHPLGSRPSTRPGGTIQVQPAPSLRAPSCALPSCSLRPRRAGPSVPGPALPLALAAGAADNTAHVDATTQWTVYHGNPLGTGADTSGVTFNPPSPAWKSPTLDGQVYGEPLEATGRVFVATENDTIYALAANTGAVLWSTHVGTPVPSGDLPCGDISPTVGITGHAGRRRGPRGDLRRGRRAEHGAPAHVLVGLNIYTGASMLGTGGRSARDRIRAAILQRTGLNLSNGNVVFGYGGNDGDCSTYSGWVVSVPEGGGTPGYYQAVPIGHDGAVWMGGAAPEVDARGQHLGGHRERVVVGPLRLQRLGARAVAGPGPHAVLRARPPGRPTTPATSTSDRARRRCSPTGPSCRWASRPPPTC